MKKKMRSTVLLLAATSVAVAYGSDDATSDTRSSAEGAVSEIGSNCVQTEASPNSRQVQARCIEALRERRKRAREAELEMERRRLWLDEAMSREEWGDEVVEAVLTNSVLLYYHNEDVTSSLSAICEKHYVSEERIADALARIARRGQDSTKDTREHWLGLKAVACIGTEAPDSCLTNLAEIAVSARNDDFAAKAVYYYHFRKSGSDDFIRFAEHVMASRSLDLASKLTREKIWVCVYRDAVKLKKEGNPSDDAGIREFARRHILDDRVGIRWGNRTLELVDDGYKSSGLRGAAALRAKEIAPDLLPGFNDVFEKED